MNAVDATIWYELLITVGGIGGDFSQPRLQADTQPKSAMWLLTAPDRTRQHWTHTGPALGQK